MERRKALAEQIKPFNFLLVADVDPFGYPPIAPQRFRLIAAYSSNPDEWEQLEWRNYTTRTDPATTSLPTEMHPSNRI